MHSQTDSERRVPDGLPMMSLSEDGYVRLTLESLRATPLRHLLSGLDEDTPVLSWEGATFGPITGYTEWVSTTTPTITLGWDWRLDVSKGRPRYERLGPPRSNVMLIDAQRHDFGPNRTEVMIEAFIDSFAWQYELHTHIVTRYR